MSLIPCDYCGLRVPEKLCQATWAWYRADGVRVAYRQRLCTGCFCANVLPLDVEANYEALTCPACGIDTSHDMDPMYATCFLPGSGKRSIEAPTCAACATELRVRAQKGATKLEDKEQSRGQDPGPSTPTTRESYWANLGILPRKGEVE